MGKILKATWITVCFIALAIYLVSCLSPYIPPSAFSLISILALLFPYLFILVFVCGVSLLFIKKKPALIILLVIMLIGFKNLSNTIALHAGHWAMAKSDSTLRIVTWNAEGFVDLSLK